MPGADFLDLGSWNAHCAKCGFKFKANELIKESAGAGLSSMYVCRKCWRPRQPQEFVRGIPEKPQAPWIQKFPDTYTDMGYALTTDSGAGSDLVEPELLMTDDYSILVTDEGTST